jgi:Skp family chaperone for outer membrane proteins
MKTQFLLSTILTAALAFSTSALAGSNHDHGLADTTKDAHAHKDFGSVKDAWKTLDDTVTKAEASVTSGDFKTIDGLNHELEAVLHYLQDNSKAADETKQKRLQGGLKQLSVAVDQLHEQGHNPTKEGLEKTLKRVRGAMKMAETQYPAGAIK